MVCSAGGTGLRNWVCCLTLHDQLLLVGSSLLLSPGVHPRAGAAGWALPQLSVSDLPFPSPLSLSRASPVSPSLASDHTGCVAEILKHGMLQGLPPGESFRLCPTAAPHQHQRSRKAWGLDIPIVCPTSLLSNM